MARRHAHVHLGGYWEFPGGKCEDGENACGAAVRELLEECAVRAAALRALPAVRCDYGDRVIEITPVLCRWESGEGLPLGCAECRWVTLGELAALPMPPMNAEIVAQLKAAGV